MNVAFRLIFTQIDKSIYGYGAILGMFEETHITQAQYNITNTLFYIGE